MANNKEASLLLRIKTAGEAALDSVVQKIDDIGKYSAIAFAAFSAVIAKSISDLREEEQATQQLNQAMINTGVYTKDLAKKYEDLASKLQQNSLYGDEQIKQAQAIIQTNIGQREVTESLTKATLDFAAAQRIDLATAAELVGKTIGTSTNALGRHGVEIDSNMSKQQKLDAVITAINSKWKDQARAQAEGLGSLTKMKNAFSDLMETLGSKFAPMIGKISDFFTKLFNGIGDSEPLVNLIAVIISGGAAISGFITVVAGLAAGFIALNTAAAALGLTISALLGPISLAAVAIGALGGAVGYYLTQSDSMTKSTKALKGEIESTEEQLKRLEAQMNRGVGSIGMDQMKVYAIEADRVRKKLEELKAQETKNITTEEQKKQDQLNAIQAGGNATRLKEHQDNLIKEAEKTKEFQDFDIQNRQIDHQMRMAELETNEQDKLIAIGNAELARLNLVSGYMQQLIDKETDKQKKITLIGQQEELKRTIADKTSKQNQAIFEEELRKKKEQDFRTALSTTASLQNSSNRHLAALGKAAALTEMAIDGPKAIVKALGSAPPPFNFALAAGVGAAIATQVANVAGVPLAEGGVVMPRVGGTQATIGEAGQPEAVIPLDRFSEFGMGGGGTTVVINVQGGMLGSESEAREFALAVDKELLKLRRNNESVSFDSGVI